GGSSTGGSSTGSAATGTPVATAPGVRSTGAVRLDGRIGEGRGHDAAQEVARGAERHSAAVDPGRRDRRRPEDGQLLGDPPEGGPDERPVVAGELLVHPLVVGG